jgi:haloalkane dehalogenase
MRLFRALFAFGLLSTSAMAAPLAWTGPVPEDLVAESHFVEVNGHTWHYVESGEGPPLVLLHGLPVQSYLWRHVIPELAKTHRVIVPDILGYGRSDKDDSIQYNPPALARAFDGFMATMDFEEPVTLGVTDLGSVLGLTWAMNHEEAVRALILVEAVIYNGEDFFKAAPLKMKLAFKALSKEKSAKRLMVEKNLIVESIPKMMVRTLSDTEKAEYDLAWEDLAVRERVLMAAGPNKMPKKGITTNPAQGTASMDAYAPWLATTKVPKLVLTAKPGLVIQRDDVKHIEKNFLHTTIVPIGRGKHFVVEDEPDAFTAATLSWLDSLPASR